MRHTAKESSNKLALKKKHHFLAKQSNSKLEFNTTEKDSEQNKFRTHKESHVVTNSCKNIQSHLSHQINILLQLIFVTSLLFNFMSEICHKTDTRNPKLLQIPAKNKQIINIYQTILT